MNRAWTRTARCRTSKNPDLWFPATYTGGLANVQLREARSECLACPVRQACLAEAMRQEEGLPKASRFGVWAGTTPKQRYQLDPTVQKPVTSCGSISGFRQHIADGTEPCQACQTAEDQRVARLQENSPCGTVRGYGRHATRREKACDECREAQRLYRQKQRAAARAKLATA